METARCSLTAARLKPLLLVGAGRAASGMYTNICLFADAGLLCGCCHHVEVQHETRTTVHRLPVCTALHVHCDRVMAHAKPRGMYLAVIRQDQQDAICHSVGEDHRLRWIQQQPDLCVYPPIARTPHLTDGQCCLQGSCYRRSQLWEFGVAEPWPSLARHPWLCSASSSAPAPAPSRPPQPSTLRRYSWSTLPGMSARPRCSGTGQPCATSQGGSSGA